ncbi:hypothetical protein VPH35_018745 [Triticum aestivum]
MSGADRLSDLSEDLLQSIVSFLPARDAARTSALSRQWRPLWLRTDSLNLDSRSYRKPGQDYAGHGRDGIQVNNPSAQPAGTGGQQYFEDVMGNSRWGPSRNRNSCDLMASLLDAPPLGHLEDLRVRFEVVKNMRQGDKLSCWIYKLDPAVLPGHALRVLDLVFCRLESEPREGGGGSLSFPCLSVLRLYMCSSSTSRFALHSSSLTDLTLVDSSGNTRLEGTKLDTPCLRTFKYSSFILTELWMKSQPIKLARADLTLGWTYGDNGNDLVLPRFAQVWKFLGHFRHAKVIRLKVQNIRCIAVEEGVQHEHLVMLPALERLELEGFADPGRRDDPDRKGDAATAIANLLHCCLVIRDYLVSSPDFDVSMDLFRRRFSKEMVPLMLDLDDHGSSRVAQLPGLTGRRFSCLENHLKKVTMRFELKELNSFEVRLARFFAENCMVLDVLQIEDGKHNFLSHINWTVQRWRTDAMDQRKQIGRESADSSKQSRKRKDDYRKRMFASYT